MDFTAIPSTQNQGKLCPALWALESHMPPNNGDKEK